MNDYISHGLWLANMHAECRTEVSENELRAHLIKAVAMTHELAKQRDELAKLCNYNERVMQELLQQRDELLAALEKLARLGNEPHYGNSIRLRGCTSTKAAWTQRRMPTRLSTTRGIT